MRGCPHLERVGAIVTLEMRPFGKSVLEVPSVRAPNGKDLVTDDGIDLLRAGDSGSNAFVYSIRTIHGERMVAKVATPIMLAPSKYKRVIAGTLHEKKVYAIMRALVKARATPFVLTSIPLEMPERVICTETHGDATTLSKYIRMIRPSVASFKALLFSLLYTLEVLHRIGVRHNDLHPGNIMMVPSDSNKPLVLEYVTRNGERHHYHLPKMKWVPRIYDFDRVFKLRRRDVRPEFRGGLNARPVLNRWDWYNPSLDTPSLNALKLYTHLNREVRRSGLSALVKITSPLSLTTAERSRLEREHSFDERLWRKYHIATGRGAEAEVNMSNHVPDIEVVLMKLLRPRPPAKGQTPDFSIKRIVQ
jgi:hypothetical protein